MTRQLMICALLIGASASPLAPAEARGPKPVPVGECQPSISYSIECAYQTKDECLLAYRALRRQYQMESGCWYSTADPDWWGYHRWILSYYP